MYAETAQSHPGGKWLVKSYAFLLSIREMQPNVTAAFPDHGRAVGTFAEDPKEPAIRVP